MIEAIKDLGEYNLQINSVNFDPKNPALVLSYLVENPFIADLKKGTKRVIIINFNEDGKYINIADELFDTAKLIKYLYRTEKGNAPPITPSIKLHEKIEERITKFFDSQIRKNSTLSPQNKDLFNNVSNELKTKQTMIRDDINTKHITKDDKILLTIKIDGDFIGDIPLFNRIFLNSIEEDFYSTEKFSSFCDNKVCSVCKQQKPEIYGIVRTYKFYNVDQPGFVSEFNQGNNWKNYPVCKECAYLLEFGKKYIEENLVFRFYGIRYKLIPEFVGTKNDPNILAFLNKMGKPEFKRDAIAKYENEKIIFEVLSKEGNYFVYNLLFYDEAGQQFKILKFIEDILPSRFKQMFDVKKKIDNIPLFKNSYLNKKEGLSFNFDFGIIKNICTSKNGKKAFNIDEFLDITYDMITGKNIDKEFMLQKIMQKIREDYWENEDHNTRIPTLQGFILLYFLKELNLININSGGNTMSNEISIPENLENIKKFFEEHKNFFSKDAEKAAYLMGVLTQQLLYIQKVERGSTPFYSKLKGLKLNKTDLEKLLSEIKNKLREYDKEYKNLAQLQELISYLFINAKDWNEMTINKINFYFALGMNTSYSLLKKTEGGGSNGE